MKKIKGVIFDLDGTLANTLPLCILAFRKSIEPFINRPISDQEIISTFGPSEEGTIMTLIPGYYEKGIDSYLKNYEIMHEICPAPFAGINELLSNLKNKSIKIGMVTGKGKYSTDISLKHFGIEHFFEVIENGSPNGPRKPDGIRSVLNYWNVSRNEVLYVGDAVSDIEACREVGIPIIAAAWAETSEPERLINYNPNEIFYSVENFSKWIYLQI
ncbi:MAG: HAD family hydrolase [Ferruginibacter sp.]